MMKKLALALVASTVALGATQANIGTGFYLGAAVGYGATTGKYTSNSAGVNTNGSVDVGGNAANIGIMGGYGLVTGCVYFGGELGYAFENAKINNTLGQTPATNSIQLKRNGYFNAALRGGYLFTPNTMLYIRLGANWGKWTLNSSLPPFSAALPASGSKNRLSFAPGLGLETAIHKNVYLRVEYVYEFGPSVRATRNAVNSFANVGQIRSQSGKIGLAYKF
jgi:opacity protein-like surface antigen